MTTRGGLRTTVRAELNDTGGAKTWSEALLGQWLLEAIRAYGEALPRESATSIVGVANQADYALPADCLRVTRVEHPRGFFRVSDPLAAGDLIDPLGLAGGQLPRLVAEQLAYEVYGPHGARTLTLRPAPAAAETIAVRYLATWAEPAVDGDSLATPARDDQLLVWSVCARALSWLDADESKRQRFERDRGVSAGQAARAYAERYVATLAARQRRTAPRRLVVRQ